MEDFINSSTLNVSNELSVGNPGVAGSGVYISEVGLIGIGTNIPSSTFQIFKNDGISDINVTNKDGESRISIGNSIDNKSSATLRFGNYPNTFDIINYDTGNINMYLHAGPSGIDTGRFAWLYGRDNSELASLTYQGNFGIGITNPIHNLHVVGTSTVTSNFYVGGDLTVANNLKVLNGIKLPPILTNTNIESNSGVSTISNLNITKKLDVTYSDSLIQCNTLSSLSIGIGTTSPICGLDARTGTLLVDRIGIRPPNDVLEDTDFNYRTLDGISPNVYAYDSLFHFNDPVIVLDGLVRVGASTYFPRSMLDFGNVVGLCTFIGYFIPPSISSFTRDRLLDGHTGIAKTVEGAIIYNSTTKKHQGYGSTDNGVTFSWNDLY